MSKVEKQVQECRRTVSARLHDPSSILFLGPSRAKSSRPEDMIRSVGSSGVGSECSLIVDIALTNGNLAPYAAITTGTVIPLPDHLSVPLERTRMSTIETQSGEATTIGSLARASAAADLSSQRGKTPGSDALGDDAVRSVIDAVERQRRAPVYRRPPVTSSRGPLVGRERLHADLRRVPAAWRDAWPISWGAGECS